MANTGSGSTHAVPSLSCVCAFRFYEIDPPACVGVGLGDVVVRGARCPVRLVLVESAFIALRRF